MAFFTEGQVNHRASYRFYRRLTFQSRLLSTKMVTVWKYSNQGRP